MANYRETTLLIQKRSYQEVPKLHTRCIIQSTNSAAELASASTGRLGVKNIVH